MRISNDSGNGTINLQDNFSYLIPSARKKLKSSTRQQDLVITFLQHIYFNCIFSIIFPVCFVQANQARSNISLYAKLRLDQAKMLS